MWYVSCFDIKWVRCRNYACREEYPLMHAIRRRKCPKCKIDGKGRLPTKKLGKTHD